MAATITPISWQIMIPLLLIAGCQGTKDSSSLSSGNLRITLAQESQVSGGGRTDLVQANKPFTTKGPVTVSADGYFPMTLVPVSGSGTSLDVRLEEIPKAPADKDPQEAVNNLLIEILKAQRHISSGQGAAALTVIEGVQNNWQNVIVLDYLKASALVVSGDYARALTVIDAALVKEPESPELKELKAFIKNR